MTQCSVWMFISISGTVTIALIALCLEQEFLQAWWKVPLPIHNYQSFYWDYTSFASTFLHYPPSVLWKLSSAISIYVSNPVSAILNIFSRANPPRMRNHQPISTSDVFFFTNWTPFTRQCQQGLLEWTWRIEYLYCVNPPGQAPHNWNSQQLRAFSTWPLNRFQWSHELNSLFGIRHPRL